MALSDGLFYKLKAAFGETVPTDSVGSTTISGGAGSVILVNDGTYGYLWRVTGKMTASLAGSVKIGSVGETTIAVRYRPNRSAAPQEPFISFGNVSSTEKPYYVGDSFGALSNQSFGIMYGSVKGEQYKTITNNTVVTAVIRFKDYSSGNDNVDIWFDNPGRSGVAPEVAHASDIFVYERYFSELQVGVTNGTLDILDIAAWGRAITDAEAAAVANDIRGQLDGGSGSTISCGLASAAATGSVASILAAVTISCALGAAAGSGWQAAVTTNSPTTIACAQGVAAASGIPAGVSVSGSATITSAAFRNNTGTLLSIAVIAKLAALRLSDMTLAVSWSNQTTNGAGVLTLTSGSLTSATEYLLVASNADGSAVGVGKYTAS